MQRRREGRVRCKWTLPPPPAPVSPSHTLHAGVGEAGDLIRCQLHPCLSLLWGLDAPSLILTPPRLGLPDFLLHPTPPPILPQTPPLPQAQALLGEETGTGGFRSPIRHTGDTCSQPFPLPVCVGGRNYREAPRPSQSPFSQVQRALESDSLTLKSRLPLPGWIRPKIP